MVSRTSSDSQAALPSKPALSLFLAAAASGCGSQFESETPDLPVGSVPVSLATVASGLTYTDVAGDTGAAVDQYEWPTLAPGSGVLSFGRDATGELYLLGTDGVVHRIVPG
jgi:hypothetical protein